MGMSSGSDIYMVVPDVRDISKKFQDVSEFLQNVVKVLDTLIKVLQTAAAIGLIAAGALAQFLEGIKPQIEQVAEKCAEISKDVEDAAKAYETGDFTSARYFTAS